MRRLAWLLGCVLSLGCSGAEDAPAPAQPTAAGGMTAAGGAAGGSGAAGASGAQAGSGSGGNGGAAAGSGASAGGSGGSDGPMRCNGHQELCDRRYDQVAYPATHNAMSNEDDGWAGPNQHHPLKQQLEEGVRALLIDTHLWTPVDETEGTYLCHGICQLGNLPLVDAFVVFRTFLEEHPHEVLTLLIEDGVSPERTAADMETAKLLPYALTLNEGEPFPTLREMIQSGKRLVIFAENEGPPPAFYHHMWDWVWDTPYSFEYQEDFTCAENRGKKGNPLFLVNHWLGRPLSLPELAAEVNTYEVLGGRVDDCKKEQLPNFVAVDFYDLGALFQVVDELNGVSSN
jgi:hypothetical protein